MKRLAPLLGLAFLSIAGGARVRAGDPPAPAPAAPAPAAPAEPSAPPAPPPDPALAFPVLLRLASEQDDPPRAEAAATWKAMPAADRVASIRAALRSSDSNLAFAAAAIASPWTLDLEELHLASRALAPRPLARWWDPKGPLAELGEGSNLAGSADLLAIWRAVAEADPQSGGFGYQAPHRLLLPADVPGLIPLLETAESSAFRGLLWDLSNEAENEAGDERRDDYVRAFRYGLARLRAEAKKKPVPTFADVGPAPKKAGLPAEFVELLRATCGPLGQGFDLGKLPEAPPKPGETKIAAPPAAEGPARWLHRWALRLAPGAEDLDFLRDLVVLPRVLPQTRWWAARQVAQAAAGKGLAARTAGHALRDVLAQQDDAALFAAAELASRGSRADWERLSVVDGTALGKKRADVLAAARWLADPVAAREAAWKSLANGDFPEDLAEDERWFMAYDLGVDVKADALAWLRERVRSKGAPVRAEAWFVARVDADALDAKEAERLLGRWSSRVAEFEVFEDVFRAALARLEPFAHDAVVAFVRRVATESKDADTRAAALALLARLGDAALADAMLADDLVLKGFEGRYLGRVRDPAVEAYLRARAASSDPGIESTAVEALAIAYGAPEPLASYLGGLARADDPKADAWDAAKALVLAKDPIGAVLARTTTGPTMGSGLGQLEFTAGFGLTRDPRVVERLRAWRDERASGLYWVATACLALGGDAAARAEWRAFLAEARTYLLDDVQNGLLFTMDGDPAWVDDWVARLDANCCYSWHAHSVLEATFPTLPFDHAPGDAGRARRADERWFSTHRGGFVRSPIVDGWVPGPSKK